MLAVWHLKVFKAAHSLQSLYYRWHSKRLRWILHLTFIKKCVVKIQSAYRRRAARLLFELVKEAFRNKTALRIQTFMRTFLGRRRAWRRRHLIDLIVHHCQTTAYNPQILFSTSIDELYDILVEQLIRILHKILILGQFHQAFVDCERLLLIIDMQINVPFGSNLQSRFVPDNNTIEISFSAAHTSVLMLLRLLLVACKSCCWAKYGRTKQVNVDVLEQTTAIALSMIYERRNQYAIWKQKHTAVLNEQARLLSEHKRAVADLEERRQRYAAEELRRRDEEGDAVFVDDISIGSQPSNSSSTLHSVSHSRQSPANRNLQHSPSPRDGSLDHQGSGQHLSHASITSDGNHPNQGADAPGTLRHSISNVSDVSLNSLSSVQIQEHSLVPHPSLASLAIPADYTIPPPNLPPLPVLVDDVANWFHKRTWHGCYTLQEIFEVFLQIASWPQYSLLSQYDACFCKAAMLHTLLYLNHWQELVSATASIAYTRIESLDSMLAVWDKKMAELEAQRLKRLQLQARKKSILSSQQSVSSNSSTSSAIPTAASRRNSVVTFHDDQSAINGLVGIAAGSAVAAVRSNSMTSTIASRRLSTSKVSVQSGSQKPLPAITPPVQSMLQQLHLTTVLPVFGQIPSLHLHSQHPHPKDVLALHRNPVHRLLQRAWRLTERAKRLISAASPEAYELSQRMEFLASMQVVANVTYHGRHSFTVVVEQQPVTRPEGPFRPPNSSTGMDDDASVGDSSVASLTVTVVLSMLRAGHMVVVCGHILSLTIPTASTDVILALARQAQQEYRKEQERLQDDLSMVDVETTSNVDTEASRTNHSIPMGRSCDTAMEALSQYHHLRHFLRDDSEYTQVLETLLHPVLQSLQELQSTDTKDTISINSSLLAMNTSDTIPEILDTNVCTLQPLLLFAHEIKLLATSQSLYQARGQALYAQQQQQREAEEAAAEAAALAAETNGAHAAQIAADVSLETNADTTDTDSHQSVRSQQSKSAGASLSKTPILDDQKLRRYLLENLVLRPVQSISPVSLTASFIIPTPAPNAGATKGDADVATKSVSIARYMQPRLALSLLSVVTRRNKSTQNNEVRYATTLLQRVIRGWLGRLRFRAVYLKKREIMRRWWLASKVMLRWKEMRRRHEAAARLVQARVKGMLWRMYLQIMRSAALVLQCSYRVYHAKLRLLAELARRDGGPQVVEMLHGGKLMHVADRTFSLRVFRCGYHYRFEGLDMMRGLTYHGAIHQSELTQQLKRYNADVIADLGGDRTSLASKQAQIQLWQYEKVLNYLLAHLRLSHRIYGGTNSMGGADLLLSPSRLTTVGQAAQANYFQQLKVANPDKRRVTTLGQQKASMAWASYHNNENASGVEDLCLVVRYDGHESSTLPSGSFAVSTALPPPKLQAPPLPAPMQHPAIQYVAFKPAPHTTFKALRQQQQNQKRPKNTTS